VLEVKLVSRQGLGGRALIDDFRDLLEGKLHRWTTIGARELGQVDRNRMFGRWT
jgi:hypothetical protein